eukprot:CAMPEP_0168405534 /NCGR_PEP_ID=MMETSP0228-20121227/25190_1 /TAXON_ID=133427 /ORGANISM="Protoceratium reticulatum, Strain CCCM 535 (=CCMP 1889)" /LENGTH=82 /DNA_ID=CAMNT_0008419163 /DNA_START=155 /DNA_END=400 /DNA_ORIENTATION=+
MRPRDQCDDSVCLRANVQGLVGVHHPPQRQRSTIPSMVPTIRVKDHDQSPKLLLRLALIASSEHEVKIGRSKDLVYRAGGLG